MKGRVQCLTVLARATRKLVLDHHFDLPEPAEQNRRHQVFLRAAAVRPRGAVPPPPRPRPPAGRSARPSSPRRQWPQRQRT